MDVVGKTVVGKSRHKRKKKIHPATRVFQVCRNVHQLFADMGFFLAVRKPRSSWITIRTAEYCCFFLKWCEVEKYFIVLQPLQYVDWYCCTAELSSDFGWLPHIISCAAPGASNCSEQRDGEFGKGKTA